MRLTRVHLAYVQNRRLPAWASRMVGGVPKGPSIDEVVNANAGVRPTSRELAVMNTLTLVRMRMRRGESLDLVLCTLSSCAGARRRKSDCARWARRILSGRLVGSSVIGSAGEALRPMSVTEREWCVDEADRAGEGFYKADELRALSDQDLACNVLHAWRMYVASQVG